MRKHIERLRSFLSGPHTKPLPPKPDIPDRPKQLAQRREEAEVRILEARAVLEEGKVRKGGVNRRPMGPRPKTPPHGQIPDTK